MTKAQLKELITGLESLGVPDSAEIKVERAIDNARMALAAAVFKFEGQDAEYTIDASGHWAPAVSQANAVILKEAQ